MSSQAQEWAELAYFFGSLKRHRWTRDPELARECLRMMFNAKRDDDKERGGTT